MNATPGVPRTALKPSAYTNYADEMEGIARHINRLVQATKRLKSIDVEVWGNSLRNSYRNFAQCCVLTDDVATARTYYHNATRLDNILSGIVRNNKYPELQKKGDLPRFNTKFMDGFPEAILANDEVLLREFAKSQEPGDNPQSDRRFGWHVTNAIRSHILGDEGHARQQIMQAHKLEYFRLGSKGFSHAVMGIIARDPYLLNEGIDLRLLAHKTTEFKSIYFEYCEEATVLARLAIRAGLRPNIQSSFISKKLLTGAERSTEDSVDQLLKSLQEANDRKGNLLWFLRRLFRFN
ncbi:MAG: hypothetical protein WDO15_01160 [Bacteroidota bacterium]